MVKFNIYGVKNKLKKLIKSVDKKQQLSYNIYVIKNKTKRRDYIMKKLLYALLIVDVVTLVIMSILSIFINNNINTSNEFTCLFMTGVLLILILDRGEENE